MSAAYDVAMLRFSRAGWMILAGVDIPHQGLNPASSCRAEVIIMTTEQNMKHLEPGSTTNPLVDLILIMDKMAIPVPCLTVSRL